MQDQKMQLPAHDDTSVFATRLTEALMLMQSTSLCASETCSYGKRANSQA